MKNKKNRKLHGSVLLTVVVVMSLLIVFLFGTLALATAANNRAHVNYSSSQTGVTSRMVAQSAVDAMDSSLTYRQVIGNIKSGSAPVSVPVTIGNAGSFNAGALGDVDPVEVSYAGKKKIYDTDKKQWVDRDMLKFTSKVTMGGVESQTSAYVLRLLDTDPPKSSGKGAALVTAAGATLTCKTSIYGGGYINIPNMKDSAEAAKYSYYKTSATPSTALPAYNKGDASTYTNFTNSGAIGEADIYINNNVFIDDWSGFVFPSTGTGITIWGDLDFDNDVVGHLKFQASDSIDFKDVQFNQMPYVYVDGKLWVANKFVMGDETKQFPLNLFCGSIYKPSDVINDFVCAANIYCMDESATSRIVPMHSTKLFTWTDSVINQSVSSMSKQYASSISTKGNLEIQNMDVQGDILVQGDCKILKSTKGGDSTVRIGGNLVVGGTLTIESGAKLVFYDGDGDGNRGGIYCNNPPADYVEEPPAPKPGYTKLDTIEHDGKVDETKYTKVENMEIPYLVLDPVYYPHKNEWGDVDGYSDYAGNNLIGDNTKLVYTWKEGIDPSPMINKGKQISEQIDKMDFTDPNYNADVFKLWNDFYIEAKGYIDETIAPFSANSYPDGNTTYRVKTYLSDPADPASATYSKAEPTTDQYSYYDPATGTPVYETAPFRTMPQYDTATNSFIDSGVVTTSEYVWYKDTAPGTWVDEKEVYGTSLGVKTIDQFYAAYHTDQVYPKYAERRVLLGLDGVPNPNGSGELPKKTTKVITRLDEIQAKIDDPYANRGIPSQFTNIYNTLKSKGVYLNGRDDIIKAMDGKYAASIGGAGNDLYQITMGTESLLTTDSTGATVVDNNKVLDKLVNGAVKGALYINENCMLTGSLENDLVIDTDGNELFIVVKDFSMSNERNIIIDDSKGGSVTFYVEDNSVFRHNGNGSVATISYLNLFKNYKDKPIQYTHDSDKVVKDPATNIAYPNIAGDITETDGSGNVIYSWKKERVRPSIEIYGGTNSTFEISNVSLLTANILTPDMTVKIKGTTSGDRPSEFYYNGYNVYKPFADSDKCEQFVMGCINSDNVEFDNPLNVLYTTDSGGSNGPNIHGSGDFQYTVLYYDEY